RSHACHKRHTERDKRHSWRGTSHRASQARGAVPTASLGRAKALRHLCVSHTGVTNVTPPPETVTSCIESVTLDAESGQAEQRKRHANGETDPLGVLGDPCTVCVRRSGGHPNTARHGRPPGRLAPTRRIMYAAEAANGLHELHVGRASADRITS